MTAQDRAWASAYAARLLRLSTGVPAPTEIRDFMAFKPESVEHTTDGRFDPYCLVWKPSDPFWDHIDKEIP